MNTCVRTCFVLWLAGLATSFSVQGQTTSGFIAFNRLGVSYQRAFGLDIGFLSHNTRFGYEKGNFFDISGGAESIFAHRFVLVPKVNVDLGFRTSLFESATLGGGIDAGWQTDFSSGCWRITPKVGLTWGSFLRIYYGFHFDVPERSVDRIGSHRLSLELNIAAIHDLRIGN